LKAYKKQVVKTVDVGDMHRYIPVLAAHAGFKNITERSKTPGSSWYFKF
jgi:hypothetical protein